MVSFLPITGQNTEGSQHFDREILEVQEYFGELGISQRVEEEFRGFEENFGEFYEAERGLKNVGGAREGTEKAFPSRKLSEWEFLEGL